jgi:hypothetical protein
MAWEDPTELVVGQTGALSVAPIGTPVPTTPTAALNSAFVGLGYTDEDGVTLTNDPTVTDFAVWQSRNPARRELTSLTISVTAKLAQWNETTVPLASTASPLRSRVMRSTSACSCSTSGTDRSTTATSSTAATCRSPSRRTSGAARSACCRSRSGCSRLRMTRTVLRTAC